ncbi:MAG: glutathione S-transferase C-terminal domain-containing protein [Waterburya sp.]
MIDLYTFTTPNGRKASIMLEEIGLDYTVHRVDITKGEQFAPEFVAINPNSKIPAIVDHDAELTIFESGAILIYLAEKTGKLLSTEVKQRWQTIEWLMLQMGSIGPMFGQYNHFNNYAPAKIPYAIERYHKEILRLYDVLNSQLAKTEYISGADYSIADIAIYPWVATFEFMELTLENHPQLQHWYEEVKQRPAVDRGMKIPG